MPMVDSESLGDITNFIVDHERYVRESVMVWGAINCAFESELAICNGNFTANAYLNQVLRPAVRPMFQQKQGLKYQQNNAPLHRARATTNFLPGRVAQSVGHLTHKSGVLGSIPGLATYFRFSFRFFKKGSCQLLAKVCARSTG